MVKLCIVTHSYPRFPGDWRSNFIESLARAYARNGAEVTVFVPLTANHGHSAVDAAGVRVVNFRYMPFQTMHTVGYGHTMKQDLGVALSDVLLMPFLLFFGIIRFAFLLRKEKFEVVQAHWAVPNALIAVLARALVFRQAFVMTSFPGSDVTVIKKAGWIGRVMSRIIARSDYLSCNSSDLREDLEKTGLFRRPIDYAIYGVDDKTICYSEQGRARLRRDWGVPENDIVLLLIGRFVPKKGFSTAFRSLKSVTERRKNILLVVVGDGPLKSEYDDILKTDGTASFVRFIGEIPTQELSRYYSACDIFLMPSRRLPSDGLNVVVPEAMACARPIVASNVGGNDLVVFSGINGYLHEADDHEQLAAFVLELAEDAGKRREMGQESLRLVRERFNWDAIARNYLARYRETAVRGKGR